MLDCNKTSQSGPFRGATRSKFEIALEEKLRLMVPGFFARIFRGERPCWRRTTRKVSFDVDIVRSVIVDNFEGRQAPSEDNAPTRSQTFDLQRIVLEDVEQFWFSTDNVLWIRRAEDDVALIGGLSNDQRLTIQRDLERYLEAKGMAGLFDARTRAA